MNNNICEKCKKEIKEIYYFGLKRIILCKNCYKKKIYWEDVFKEAAKEIEKMDKSVTLNLKELKKRRFGI